MGDTGDMGVVLVVAAVVLLFAFVFWPAWTAMTGPTWNIEASVSPVDSGSVSPAGNNTVRVNQSITFSALDNENFTFQNWIFDNANYGAQPQISIPAQSVNSTHKLIAVFVPKSPAFEIIPPKTFVRGQVTNFLLTLNNNAGTDISSVQVKLNDPYGVFDDFVAVTGWHWEQLGGGTQPYGANYISVGACLNQYITYGHDSLNTLLFDSTSSANGHRNILAHSSATFQCGGILGTYNSFDWGGDVKVSSTITPGTYHLSWDIIFNIDSGSFYSPPNLTVPWDVTVMD
ncbi:MAG: hypothetical protein WC325_09900 [Candidatus Bathyarchaeia archaeon]|jgi:hypothetical protein